MRRIFVIKATAVILAVGIAGLACIAVCQAGEFQID